MRLVLVLWSDLYHRASADVTTRLYELRWYETADRLSPTEHRAETDI